MVVIDPGVRDQKGYVENTALFLPVAAEEFNGISMAMRIQIANHLGLSKLSADELNASPIRHFDTVILSNALNYMNGRLVLDQVAQSMKPGALLVIQNHFKKGDVRAFSDSRITSNAEFLDWMNQSRLELVDLYGYGYGTDRQFGKLTPEEAKNFDGILYVALRQPRSEVRESIYGNVEKLSSAMIWRAQILPWDLASQMDLKEAVRILSELLRREVYSEKAGILPETQEAILAWQEGDANIVLAEAVNVPSSKHAAGQVVISAGLWNALMERSPESLKIFAQALQAMDADTSPFVVSGTKSQQDAFWESLLNRRTGLSVVEQQTLQKHLRFFTEDQLDLLKQQSQHAVVALRLENETMTAIPSQFVIRENELRQLHDQDLLGVLFAGTKLRLAAGELKGIAAASRQHEVLKTQLLLIFPEARWQGSYFEIQFTEFLEHLAQSYQATQISA